MGTTPDLWGWAPLSGGKTPGEVAGLTIGIPVAVAGGAATIVGILGLKVSAEAGDRNDSNSITGVLAAVAFAASATLVGVGAVAVPTGGCIALLANCAPADRDELYV